MGRKKQGIDHLSLTNKEFYQQACRWKDSMSIKTAQDWWEAFCEVIIRECYYNGTVRLPNIGTISVKEIPAGYQTQTDKNGKKTTYFQPERVIPQFVANDDFINDINMQGVTKAYRRRLKNNALTQRDKERQLRADSINVSGTMSQERQEAAQQNFADYLAQKKQQKGQK